MTAEDQGSEGNGPTPPGSPIHTAGGSARSGSQGLPPGTTAKWQGPYEVVEREGEVNYRVRQPGRRKPTQLYHVNILKQWRGGVDPPDPAPLALAAR